MLNGIGGNTIREAKENLSFGEFVEWRKYIAKRGSLNTGRRLEAGFGLVSTVINNAHGGKAKLSDFMPYESKVEDKEGTLEDVMGVISSVAVRGDA